MSWLRPIDEWFASSVLAYEADLLRQARRWAQDEDDARDLLQETYAKMLQLDGWRSIANPAAYAVRIIRNEALQRLRHARVVPIRQFVALEEAEFIDPVPDGFTIAESRETLRRLMEAVEALPPACRRVMMLRKFEEMPPRDIAAYLGISLSTVEKHLTKAMVLLSRLMEYEPEKKRKKTIASPMRNKA